MAPNPGLIRYHGRLERILKDITLRLKLILTLEFFLRLAAVFIIILLGSLFVEELKGLFPYLPFAYSLLSLAILGWVLLQGLRRAAAGLTLQRVARGLEEKIPLLKDDVTNSLLLFYQIRKKTVTDNISEGLVTAHLRKTVAAVSKIRPGQVLSYKKVLSHLKLVVPLVLAFAAVVTLDSQFLGRSTAAIFKPVTVLPLRETIISLEKAPAIVLRGASLPIRAGDKRIHSGNAIAQSLAGEGRRNPLHDDSGGKRQLFLSDCLGPAILSVPGGQRPCRFGQVPCSGGGGP